MSSIAHGGGMRRTPRHRLHPPHDAARFREVERLQLSLETVIGTTTSSPNAFDCDSARHSFAYCAGPAAIISYVYEDLKITQRLFRARQNALPINATSSFYNPSTPPTTPSKSKLGSPLKDGPPDIGCGASTGYTPESPGMGRIQNRVREATCVSLSRQASFLAVGETGYSPRVLLFSTAHDSPADVPLSVLTDHSFGVQSVAFSPNTQWICSLGNSYDGFLLLYSMNQKTGTARLHSSNKCSNVQGICWMGNSVISFGTRHVKVWRVEESDASNRNRSIATVHTPTGGSPGPKTFSGRNCILGALLDATFTAAAAIAPRKAILTTSDGDICLLDCEERLQKLERIAKMSFGARSAHYDDEADCVWIGGDAGQLEGVDIRNLSNVQILDKTPQVGVSSPLKVKIIAIGSVRNRNVIIDSDRVVEIIDQKTDVAAAPNVSKRLPAHESAVLGICSLMHWQSEDQVDFVTYSARGTVLFWRFDGTCCGRVEVPVEQQSDTCDLGPNELKTMIASDQESVLLTGDKTGLLRSVRTSNDVFAFADFQHSVIDRTGSSLGSVQAHKGEVNGIAMAKTGLFDMICTCGRDRTLQLYNRTAHGLNLLQTLDDHAASVTDLVFIDGGSILISISSDRTVLVRKAAHGDKRSIAFLSMRVITLKASPVSFCTVPFEPTSIVLSTMDRQIQKFDISSGRLIQAFKATHPGSNDSVLANSLQVTRIEAVDDHLPVILAVSSTDRSIRLHDYNNGSLVTREYGQSAVSAARVLQRDQDGDIMANLVSCGLDGTVIVYSINPPSSSQRFDTPSNSPVRAESPLKQSATPTQPPRKTLTKAEVAEFQRALAGSHNDNAGTLRSPSPTRLRKQPSRYGMANSPRIGNIGTHSTNYMSSTTSSQRKTSQDHSPPPTSPKSTIKISKPKARPSLDHRHRSKSAANLNDLNVSAKQVCEDLRTLRNRITSSVSDKLKADLAHELRQELELTVQAMAVEPAVSRDASRGGAAAPPPLTGPLLDAYLSKMIDERLELKTNRKENDGPSAGDSKMGEQAGVDANAAQTEKVIEGT